MKDKLTQNNNQMTMKDVMILYNPRNRFWMMVMAKCIFLDGESDEIEDESKEDTVQTEQHPSKQNFISI